jgi:hypothetical protein
MAQYPEVQFATLVDAAPAGDKWLHEIKFDGISPAGFRGGRRRVSSYPSLLCEIVSLLFG